MFKVQYFSVPLSAVKVHMKCFYVPLSAVKAGTETFETFESNSLSLSHVVPQ